MYNHMFRYVFFVSFSRGHKTFNNLSGIQPLLDFVHDSQEYDKNVYDLNSMRLDKHVLYIL